MEIEVSGQTTNVITAKATTNLCNRGFWERTAYDLFTDKRKTYSHFLPRCWATSVEFFDSVFFRQNFVNLNLSIRRVFQVEVLEVVRFLQIFIQSKWTFMKKWIANLSRGASRSGGKSSCNNSKVLFTNPTAGEQQQQQQQLHKSQHSLFICLWHFCILCFVFSVFLPQKYKSSYFELPVICIVRSFSTFVLKLFVKIFPSNYGSWKG